MADLKDTLAKFTSALSFQEKITTLHSGTVIEKPILEPCEKDDELISKAKEMVELEHCKEKTNSTPVLPFPHAMINIHLLDGRPFLTTSNALINYRNGVMKLSFRNMTLEMNVFNICKQPGDDNDLQEVDFIEKLVYDQFETTSSEIEFNESKDLQMVYFQEESKANSWRQKIKKLPPRSIESIPSSVQPPKPYLKPLSFNLKYLFLGENETFLVIISSKLNAHQKGKLLQTLKINKNALRWTIAVIKGISPLICTHKIYLEEIAKPSREMQRMLNPNMKEIVRNEAIKLLDNIIIYPISDSK
ncbi:hypothetical protein NC652_028715 [Populus alba x Populus x berolinensis]|nr:hypothetical protein NC652_028715 [Populus alba x Populus x berolinensis]